MFAELPALWGGGVSVGESKSLLSANLTFILCVGELEEPVPAYWGETAPERTCFNVKAPLSAELFPFKFNEDPTCSLEIVIYILIDIGCCK